MPDSTLKRVAKEFADDKLTHWAAALTYYAVLSIFPALLVLVSILGLVGDSAIRALMENLETVAPGPAKDIIAGAPENVQQGSSAGALVIALAGAIWAASGDVSALMDAANGPFLVAVVATMFGVLYYAAPNVKQPGFGWVIPGGLVAVLLWIAVSVAFAFYVANFASYNKTHGSLGGVVVFLVWLWLSNLAILIGAELNAERARGRQMAAGQPAEKEPYLPPVRSPPAGSSSRPSRRRPAGGLSRRPPSASAPGRARRRRGAAGPDDAMEATSLPCPGAPERVLWPAGRDVAEQPRVSSCMT